MSDITIVIQAGGESSRMGEDKGLKEFGGMPLVAFIYDQVKELGKPVILISNSPADYQQFTIPVFSDVKPGIGSLGGLLTALTYSKSERCLLLACDMPFVRLDLIYHMLKIAKNSDVVIPAYKGWPEPFRAIYSRECLGPVAEMISLGKRRMVSFFDLVKVEILEEELVKDLDPTGSSFLNLNTLEEYELAKEFLNRSQNS